MTPDDVSEVYNVETMEKENKKKSTTAQQYSRKKKKQKQGDIKS